MGWLSWALVDCRLTYDGPCEADLVWVHPVKEWRQAEGKTKGGGGDGQQCPGAGVTQAKEFLLNTLCVKVFGIICSVCLGTVDAVPLLPCTVCHRIWVMMIRVSSTSGTFWRSPAEHDGAHNPNGFQKVWHNIMGGSRGMPLLNLGQPPYILFTLF